MAKRSKKKCVTCTCYCLYFPQEPFDVQEEVSVNGVKTRRVVRKCLYDMSIINSWDKQCGRTQGPCLPKPFLPKPDGKKTIQKGPSPRGTAL